jgi:hypothetical protein
MEDVVRHDDGDDKGAGVDTDDEADRWAAIGDEAVDVAVDEAVVFVSPGAIEPESRRRPPKSTRKWTLPNVMSILPLRPEKAGRDVLVRSKVAGPKKN